jgi:hypothetical protein
MLEPSTAWGRPRRSEGYVDKSAAPQSGPFGAGGLEETTFKVQLVVFLL